MRVVVFGAGAMGSFVGAALSRSAQVTLVARAAHARTISRRGLTVEGLTRGTFRVAATTSPAAARDADLVVLTTKAYDTPEAARQIRRAGARGAVLSLQNGLTNVPTLLSTLRGNPVLGGSTTHGVTFLRPGVVRHAGRGEVVIGPARGPPSILRAVARLLRSAGLPCRTTTDLDALLWRKAVVNAAVNPLTAILRAPNGALLDHAESRLLCRLAAGEAAAVAAVQGWPLKDPWRQVERVLTATAANRSSMLQDIEAGRPTEVESITGQIVRAARLHGVPVPVNEGLLQAMRAL